MNKAAQQFADDRTTRNAARATFDARLAQVKADLEARGVGGRIADKASGEVKAALSEGLAVAKESKGVIAGTIGALLLWFFRGPALAAFEDLFKDDAEPGPAPVQEQPDKPRAKRRRAKEAEQ